MRTAIGQTGHAARLDSHAPRFQGRLQLSSSSTTARAWRNIQVIADAQAAELRDRGQAALARLQRHRRGEVKASGGKGQATEVHARRDHRPRLGRSRSVSAAEEAALVREAARMGPPAAADQHVRRGRPRAQPHLPVDPRFLPGGGLPLRPHADHHGQRLRRGRARCSA